MNGSMTATASKDSAPLQLKLPPSNKSNAHDAL
jgi:hypothetical protein